MDNRRHFLKRASMLTGAMGLQAGVPPAIERAMAISPDQGTTSEDAEHVVFLMQENRSFDHCFGTLQGVRGSNDPRAITLPNRSPVWLIVNHAKNESWKLVISDQAYGNEPISVEIAPGTTETVAIPTTRSHGWCDFCIQVRGAERFHQRYAWRVETGQPTKTDPLMAKVM